VPSFVNYKKGCTRLASDKVYPLLAQGWWLSPASSTTKTGRHDIAEGGVKHQNSFILTYEGIFIQFIKNPFIIPGAG
jgi:hypothetical protein